MSCRFGTFGFEFFGSGFSFKWGFERSFEAGFPFAGGNLILCVKLDEETDWDLGGSFGGRIFVTFFTLIGLLSNFGGINGLGESFITGGVDALMGV